MEVIRTYTIELSEREANILKDFLGSFTDPQYAEHNIQAGFPRALVQSLYDELPDEKRTK